MMEYCSIQLMNANTLVYQFLALKSLIKDLIDIVLDWEEIRAGSITVTVIELPITLQLLL